MKATPPRVRSRAALGLTAAAAVGRFELQVCRACNAVQYPPREACHRCLSSLLDWKLQSGAGELLAETRLLHSHEEFFRARIPIRLGLVRLDSGPTAVAYLHSSVRSRVKVEVRLDRAGQGVLVAFAEGHVMETNHRAEDRHLQEMTCDPHGRKVLVTDSSSALGQALAASLTAAGAEVVTSAGPRIDIVINNADVVGSAREQMEAHYFGLLRLAEELGPRVTVAWVNVLSIYALASLPELEAFSASMAAALSLSHSLRAQMLARGVRVINVFPGSLETERYRAIPVAKLHPTALARAITKSLQDSVEDVYPGDVAQEWFARWRESPKVLEREIAQ